MISFSLNLIVKIPKVNLNKVQNIAGMVIGSHNWCQKIVQRHRIQTEFCYLSWRQTYMVDDAKLVSSCFNLPSRARPRLSRLFDSNGVNV